MVFNDNRSNNFHGIDSGSDNTSFNAFNIMCKIKDTLLENKIEDYQEDNYKQQEEYNDFMEEVSYNNHENNYINSLN